MIEIFKGKPNDMIFVAKVCRDVKTLYDLIMPGAF